MPDFLRFLPLSARAPGDESGVTSDRRLELDALLSAVSPFLETTAHWRAFADDAGLGRDWKASSDDPARFRAAVGARRRGIRVLARAMATALRSAQRAGRVLSVDPMAAGAVALYAHARGPFERRAVVAGHTIRASDAEWAFGTGPVLEGTSVEIAGFLLGVTERPPRPPAPERGRAGAPE